MMAKMIIILSRIPKPETVRIRSVTKPIAVGTLANTEIKRGGTKEKEVMREKTKDPKIPV